MKCIWCGERVEALGPYTANIGATVWCRSCSSFGPDCPTKASAIKQYKKMVKRLKKKTKAEHDGAIAVIYEE